MKPESPTTYIPKVGEVLDVRTSRFGRATVKILSMSSEWAVGNLIAIICDETELPLRDTQRGSMRALLEFRADAIHAIGLGNDQPHNGQFAPYIDALERTASVA